MDTPDIFTKLISQLEYIKKEVGLAMLVVKGLQKKDAQANKQLKHNKSGFMKPVEVSEPLAALIAIPSTELIARCVVNKKINEYIKSNNLQVPSNRQTFTIDARLASVFEVEVGTVIHYFKMQSYLKHHYPKSAKQILVIEE
jgi:chromatin remodeling complex protein RSC6